MRVVHSDTALETRTTKKGPERRSPGYGKLSRTDTSLGIQAGHSASSKHLKSNEKSGPQY